MQTHVIKCDIYQIDTCDRMQALVKYTHHCTTVQIPEQTDMRVAYIQMSTGNVHEAHVPARELLQHIIQI